MALEKNAREALTDVLGDDNVSEDPAILLGYAFSPFGFYPHHGKVTPFTPAAVVLPASAEEVQRAIKVCNGHGLKHKAHSVGWGPWALAGMEGVVLFDLRRMNRIIEIDEKNMSAVVEPYVVAGQLQAESMKKGLNCHIVSAGPGHSVLAAVTSFNGMGPTGLSTGFSERNALGVEWVLPTGDILRLGAAGSGAGWFSGDGPGPSLRGIMRGYYGKCGGLGIFTKVGVKLYPWPGPEKPEVKGENPQYRMSIPKNSKYFRPYWEQWSALVEAAYKLSEAGVAFSISRQPPDSIGTYLSRTNNEFYELIENESFPVLRKHRIGLEVVILTHSEREFQFKTKVFRRILEETQGKLIEFTPEQEELLMLAHLKVCYLPRVLRPTGELATSFGMDESIGLLRRVTEAGEKLMHPYIASGQFVDEGTEGFWGFNSEQGRYLHWENAYAFDSCDPGSRMASLEYIMKTAEAVDQGGLGMAMLPNLLGPFADRFGPGLNNAQDWMRRIKNVFDPDNASDASFYISPNQ